MSPSQPAPQNERHTVEQREIINARAKLAAGAALVQLYTGFIYRGPALVAECAQALA